MRTFSDHDFDASMLWLLKSANHVDPDEEPSSPRWSERGAGSPYNKAKLRLREEVAKAKEKQTDGQTAPLEAEIARLRSELEGASTGALCVLSG